MTYQAALEELQTILTALENEEVSMDELTESVKRATVLIQFCKEKLRTVEADLQQL